MKLLASWKDSFQMYSQTQFLDILKLITTPIPIYFNEILPVLKSASMFFSCFIFVCLMIINMSFWEYFI